MNIAFSTLGCKVNTYETESLWELFADRGYNRVDFQSFADVYIINTCTVTHTGDAKSRKMIRRAIRRNPDAVIAVMGCYSQMDPQTIADIDGVDIIIGTKHRERLVLLVEDFLRRRNRILDVTDVSRYREFDETHVTHFTEHTRAFLKIQDGCNNFCTYCIIPFARGPVRSRDKASVLAEARSLIANGYQEIVLTGIHTGGYGTDFISYRFIDLLNELVQLPGLKRLRISSIELNEITDEMLELIATNDIFAKHLHIPLQSGSDTILRAMRRHYDTAGFVGRIKEIRARIPTIAITTDVIVGFPGESEAEFLKMIDVIRTLSFSEMHVFPYSARSGTKAATMDGQIDHVTKSMRVNELLRLNEQLANDYVSSLKDVSVLFERSDEHFTYGHSDTYVAVKTKRDDRLLNRIVTCDIINARYGDVLVQPKS